MHELTRAASTYLFPENSLHLSDWYKHLLLSIRSDHKLMYQPLPVAAWYGNGKHHLSDTLN